MTNSIVKSTALFLLCLVGGVIGGAVGARLSLNSFSKEHMVRTERVELVDGAGKLRAVLGSDSKDVFLRFLSPDGKPIISETIPMAARAYEKSNTPDELADFSSPRISVGSISDSGEITMEMTHHGAGRVTFNDNAMPERMILGHFSLDDTQPYSSSAWGLLVVGRGGDKQFATAMGIEAQDGVDNDYLVPQPRQARGRHD